MIKLTASLFVTLTALACAPIPSGYPTVVRFEPQPIQGPTLTDRVTALEERIAVLEARIDYQYELLMKLVAEQQNPEQVVSLLQYTEDQQLLLAELALIDARLVTALETLIELKKQRKECGHERD